MNVPLSWGKCTDARYKIIHGQVERFRFSYSYNDSEELWLSVERPGGVIFTYNLLQSRCYISVYFVAIREREAEVLCGIWKDVFLPLPLAGSRSQSDKFG